MRDLACSAKRGGRNCRQSDVFDLALPGKLLSVDDKARVKMLTLADLPRLALCPQSASWDWHDACSLKKKGSQ